MSKQQPASIVALTDAELAIQAEVSAKSKAAGSLTAATEIVKAAMRTSLFDPMTAVYSELRLGRQGAVCGKVNAKNKLGAYIGFKDFVVEKGGQPHFSSNNDGLGTELYSDFAFSYLALCANKSEADRYKVDTAPAMSVSDVQEPPARTEEPDAILDAPLRSKRELPPPPEGSDRTT